ncbi:MAG: response regulator [Spirochaetaceae bacterium]|jgi:CheY-like chemotaxis protein|nr:response regulator [Spirochaetaceae bacterium]
MPETGEKKVVLAVDDTPEALQSISSILGNDYDVRLAVDAASAEAALSKIDNVDLMLLDVEMPDVSGIKFLEKLQRNPSYKNIPVVFITAHKEDAVIKKAIKNGAKGYVTKPFSPDALLESVRFFCA